MKYDPQKVNFETKEQYGKFYDLVGLTPSNKVKPYYCTICKTRFLTPLGCGNHIIIKHAKEIIEIKEEQ